MIESLTETSSSWFFLRSTLREGGGESSTFSSAKKEAAVEHSGARRSFARFVGFWCVFTTTYIGLTTFLPSPWGELNEGNRENMGKIIDLGRASATVEAENWYEIALLATSRVSAYAVYPLVWLIFLSKCSHLRTLLNATPLQMYVPLDDLHQWHTFAGLVSGWAFILHGACHTARWFIQGSLAEKFGSQTGVTGVVAWTLTPIIVFPMECKRLRRRISFEWRKGMHYLAVPWGAAAMFHAPATHIVGVVGFPFLLYVFDFVILGAFRTYYIKTPTFERLDTGCQITFEHPRKFGDPQNEDCLSGFFVYICIPWISRHEWHAFSLYPHPDRRGSSCIFIQAVGDWTKKIHRELGLRPTTRPIWISGPHVSPYNLGVKFDKMVLVASGIGITPAFSVIDAYRDTRRVNLIWLVRDPALLEFYLHSSCKFDTDDAFTLIYYTGKRMLNLPKNLAPTIIIIHGRPQLPNVIRTVILRIEKKSGLPENIIAQAKKIRAVHEGEKVDGFSTVDVDIEATQMVFAKFKKTLGNTLQKCTIDELCELIKVYIEDAEESSEIRHPHSVALPGFKQVLDKIFPRGAFLEHEVADLFSRFDTNGDGTVDKDEFTDTCKGIVRGHIFEFQRACSDVALRFDTSETEDPSLADSVEDYVSELSTWGIMYCGSAKPVIEGCKTVAHAHGINLSVESFNW